MATDRSYRVQNRRPQLRIHRVNHLTNSATSAAHPNFKTVNRPGLLPRMPSPRVQPMKKAHRICSENRRQHGFTMIELMVAIAILAILISLAVPSFQNIIRTNQIAAQTNSLVTSLALARSEASKRGIRVSLCARTGTGCSGGTDWGAGWLVIEDRDGDGDLDAGDATLQTSPIPPQGMTITGDNPSVTFEANGENFTARVITVSKNGCSTNQMREINITTSGRTRLVKKDCP